MCVPGGDEILRAYHTPQLRQYFETKNNLPAHAMETIDFDALSSTILKIDTPRKHRIIKLIHGWLPTAEHLNRIFNKHAKCPCSQTETTSHIFQCHMYSSHRQQFRKDLKTKLNRLHTDISLSRIIMYCIQEEQGGSLKFDTSERDNALLKKAYEQQRQLGFHMIWRGIITQTFGDYQEKTYREKNFQKEYNGFSWARQLVKMFITFFENLWETRCQIYHKNSPKQGEREYLQTKIQEVITTQQDIPRTLRQFYEKAEKLITNKKGKIRNLKRWLEVASDVSIWRAYQEDYDRTLGSNIRSYIHTPKPTIESTPTNGNKTNFKRKPEFLHDRPRKRQRKISDSVFQCTKPSNLNSTLITSIREPNISIAFSMTSDGNNKPLP